MAVDLFNGDAAAGGFWDDGDETPRSAGDATSDYVEITTRPDNGTKEEFINPFDTFKEEEDVKWITRGLSILHRSTHNPHVIYL